MRGKMKALWCIIVCIISFAWCNKSSVSTPAEYVNNVNVRSNLYTVDSTYFANRILNNAKMNEGAYYPDSYRYTKSAVVDTIIYSPENDKAILFVMVEIPNKVILGWEGRDGYHFDAKCFLAQRDTVPGEWNMKWFRIMNLNRYSSYGQISLSMRRFYFEDLKEIKSHVGESRYLYNVNDSRFWDSPAWTERAQMLEKNVSGD